MSKHNTRYKEAGDLIFSLQRNISIGWVCEQISMTPAHYYQIRHGNRRMDGNTLSLLVAVLRISREDYIKLARIYDCFWEDGNG